MNNLQIAIGRITRGINWLKAFIIQSALRILGRKPKEPDEGPADDADPKTEGIEMNHLNTGQTFKLADEISGCLVEGRPPGFTVDGEFSLSVPIAQGESDFENLGEDDEDDEDNADDTSDTNDSEILDERSGQQNTVRKPENIFFLLIYHLTVHLSVVIHHLLKVIYSLFQIIISYQSQNNKSVMTPNPTLNPNWSSVLR